jgi:phosphoribosylamine--glycine ligase
VLEFNCRFGDPETQSLLPRLDGDLLAVLWAAAGGKAAEAELTAAEGAAVTVVLAAGSYPELGDSGAPIEGVEAAEAEGALVFHAGTALRDGGVVTNGGRILDVTALGASIVEARDLAYRAAGRISFPGVRYRRDIAEEAAHVPR